jgi:hypothetical protein
MHIRKFGQQIGKFHKACSKVRNVLPKSSKTLRTDIYTLMERVEKMKIIWNKSTG